MGFIYWKAFLLIGYQLISRKSFERSIWNMIRNTLWILPISVEDFAYRENGNCSNRDNWLVLSDSATVLSKTEQINDFERPFNSPNWLFWQLRSNSNIIFPFWEKDITARYSSRKSQSNEWVGAEDLRRKQCASPKRLKQK